MKKTGLQILLVFAVVKNSYEQGLQWNCKAGQGQSGKSIKHIRNVSIDTCQSKCVGLNGCIGIDYTNTNNYVSNPSCRMYGRNIARTDAGRDGRIYCKAEKKDKCSDNEEFCSRISNKEIGSFCKTNNGLETCPTRCNKEPCCDLPGNKCCKTVDGSDVDKPCMFPFKTSSGIYYDCNVDEDGPWCSTKVDGNNNHITGEGNWGKCGPECPFADNHTTSYGCPVQDVLDVATTSGNDKNAVLCCSNSGDSCYTPQPCITFAQVRFHEAKEACQAKGDRLCSETEIKSGDCCGLLCEFDRKQVWLADEGVDEDKKASELTNAAVDAKYDKCKWQKPKNKQKVGCYQKPIFSSSDASNGGISNNLSKAPKECECKAPNGLTHNGPRCEEASYCLFVPNPKADCKTDKSWRESCPCTCQD